MDKKIIRKQMLSKRQSLSLEEQIFLSDLIADKLFNSDIYKKNCNICIYQSFRGEVICDKIKEQALIDGKNVFLPITNTEEHFIHFYQVDFDTEYKKGAYDILEPIVDENGQRLANPALILMPGLAFDREKHRIGYGGGYYDRYLEQNKQHTTMALCYSFQIVEENLPSFEYDILPDYILTEKELLC